MVISRAQARKRVIRQPEEEEDVIDRPTKRKRLPPGHAIFFKEFMEAVNESLDGSEVLDPKEMMKLGGRYWRDPRFGWKQEYNEKAAIARRNLPPISKQKKKMKQVQTNFRTRCSPKLLVSHNSALTEEQRTAVQNENPFHCLLHVQCGWLHRGFVKKLADLFNPETKTIEFRDGRCCPISEDDFSRVLGMPKGEITVPTSCDQRHRDRIREWFGEECKQPEKGINLAVLRTVLNKKLSDDQFQMAYMLFALGCFLCPTTKDAVGSRLFPCVATDNLQVMKSYKWPKLVLDWLVQEVRSYKARANAEHARDGAGVGGCLFALMIIYFDLFPMKVKFGQQGQPPIALWSMDLISKRITMEPDDVPTEESVLAAFPPHGLHDPALINLYKQLGLQFLQNVQSLRDLEGGSKKKKKNKREGKVRSSVRREKQKNKLDEADELMGDKEEGGEDEEDEEEEYDEDGEDDEDDDEDGDDEPPSKRDNSNGGEDEDEEEDEDDEDDEDDDEEEDDDSKGDNEDVISDDDEDDAQDLHDHGDGVGEEDGDYSEKVGKGGFSWDTPISAFQEKSANMSPAGPKKGDTSIASTRPSRRRGNRNTKQSTSMQPPFLAKRPWSKEKMTGQKKRIVDYLLRKPMARTKMKTCIKMVGAKWPLTFQDVYEAFRPRGHVSNIVVYFVRDWLMLHETEEKKEGHLYPKRHIFPPEFASNILKYNGGKCSTALRDELDAKKVGYEVNKCNLLILPILDEGHWFCVVISLVDVRVDVLDSMEPVDKSERRNTVHTLRDNFFQLLEKLNVEMRHSTAEFEICFQRVPQQLNSHDCGIYVIKFMESWNGKLASGELHNESLDNIRKFFIYKVFMDPRNIERDSILASLSKTG